MRLVQAFLFICTSRFAIAGFVNNEFGDVKVGEPFNITWTASTPSPVKLTLVGDSDPQNPGVLHEISRVAATVLGTNFQWTPSRDLNLSIAYAMQLVDGAGDVELSQGFKLVERAKSADVTTSSLLSTASSTAKSTSTPTSAASTQTPPPTPPNQSQVASPSPTSIPSSKSQISGNVRIAVSMTIVALLILVVVAIIFYEHGKRAAARTQDTETACTSAYDASDRGNGSDGLQLFEGIQAKESDGISVACLSCESHTQDGTVQGLEEGVGLGIDTQEARRKKMKSLHSIYELD